jgi:uncharacterized protein involved in response to NO
MEEVSRGRPSMKLWIPLALAVVIVFAYLFLYSMSSTDAQGASSIGLVNTVGVFAVLIGVIAAGFLLRRASPHQ